MFRRELCETRGEAMLVINNTLQPVEILEVHTDRFDKVDIKAVTITGERARYLSTRFRDRMRTSYGMVSASPFIVDVKNPSIKKVIFNDPATVVIWSDNTKTVVKCQPGDVYSKELGLAMCISKKYLGNKGNFNEEFKKWIPEEPVKESTIKTSYPPIGTKIRIIDGGTGALGANNKIGIVTKKEHSNGLFACETGYNVDCDGHIWRIKPNAKIEIIDEKTIEEMRDSIRTYCNKQKLCSDCLIHQMPDHIAGICFSRANDDEIIENYNAIKDFI